MTFPLTEPLTPQAHEALCVSIRIWAHKGNHGGASGCPLCRLYHAAWCEGCPVSVVTHNVGCRGTPYVKWEHVKWGHRECDERSARIAELDFLLSILIQDRKLRGL